ncbi:MAG TPA: LD-carboxypeptidase [Candidatus Acidoferrum sp.]|jgi:muramoyltetrapeptide carboxypeptidase
MDGRRSAGVQRAAGSVVKPKALIAGATVAAFSAASPGDAGKAQAGLAELKRLGFLLAASVDRAPEGYFATSQKERSEELISALTDERVDGLVAVRGGYGSNYLLGDELAGRISRPKVIVGYSDLTSLQIFLWQRLGWVGFYGPMVASGFSGGSGAADGYDAESFWAAVGGAKERWSVALRGETLVGGEAQGRILGGCLTLVETTLGTPWELDTRDSILILEDRGMKPWQVDRALMHLHQAGKFAAVRGIVLGDFPECEAPMAGSPTVRDVCARILAPLKVPVVFGAPIGHTKRALLTIPLGIEARLSSESGGVLEFLEAAVVP